MEITFNIIYYTNILFSLFSILITYKMSNTLISASSAFWFAWSFIIFGTNIALNNNWIMMPNAISLYYIMQLQIGAFLGFNLSSIIFQVKKDYNKSEITFNNSLMLLSKVSNNALIFLFLFGLLFLYERISHVGLNSNFFENVREVHNEGNLSLLGRIGSHIGVIVSFFIILVGIRDSKYGINVKYLIIVILSAAPLGLANGGRVFLLNYVMIYFASLMLCKNTFYKEKYILNKKDWIKIFNLILILLLVFSLIGFYRGGYGDKFDMLYTIVIWPVSTIGAMDSWLHQALISTGTNGYFTFGWFASFFNKLGLIDFSQEYLIVKKTMEHFIFTRDSAIYIPKSILIDLIFDFGPLGPIIGMFFISFLLQFFSLRFVGQSLFLHSLASLSLIASFQTIQTSIPTPPIVITLFWAFFFSILIRLKYGDRRII